MNIPTDTLLDDFAIRSFRNIADGDYVAARMACRSQLAVQYLSASQQAIEKYLKCILLLRRIPATKVLHDLSAGLNAINNSGKLALGLTQPTEEFIAYLDRLGKFRYLEVSHHAFGHGLYSLDRAVWEVRRFCTLAPEPSLMVLREGQPPPKVALSGGELESIIENVSHPARAALLWQNGFFGRRVRKKVKIRNWLKASNAPLYLNPQILDDVINYVHLPKGLVAAYRAHKKPA